MHMKIKSLITLVLLISTTITLQGCTPIKGVEAGTTAFYVETYQPRGSISVVSGEQDINSTLAFQTYKKKFESQLSMVGYMIETDPNKADFIALVAYGIDDGKTALVSTPIWGQTGGGETIYSASGEMVAYTMPTYGVKGSSTSSLTTYDRAIAMDILEAQSFKKGNPVKVYEGRTKSTGSCSVIVEVCDEMLEAMFTDFPGENARNRTQRVTGTFDC